MLDSLIAPIENVDLLIDATFRLQRLQREMVRFSRQHTEYENYRQDLDIVIRELRTVIDASVS